MRLLWLALGLGICGPAWAATYSVGPSGTYDQIADLPTLGPGDVVELERGATELRGLITSLQESEASDGVSDVDRAAIVETRLGLEVRHRETIATLERVRLQLLRLLADRQQTGALTQQLEAARAIEASLHRDVAGHAEVRRLLHRPKRTTSPGTPTPTPPPERAAA